MSKALTHKVRTNVYIDENFKKQAKEIFKKYGLTLSDAVNIFLAQAVYKKGIPFPVELPDDITLKAIEDSRKGKNMEEVTIEDLRKEKWLSKGINNSKKTSQN